MDADRNCKKHQRNVIDAKRNGSYHSRGLKNAERDASYRQHFTTDAERDTDCAERVIKNADCGALVIKDADCASRVISDADFSERVIQNADCASSVNKDADCGARVIKDADCGARASMDAKREAGFRTRVEMDAERGDHCRTRIIRDAERADCRARIVMDAELVDNCRGRVGMDTECGDNCRGRVVMDADEFARRGVEMIGHIVQYKKTLRQRRVTAQVSPGYLRDLLPATAPRRAEKFADILADVEKTIMPGITHWQHPQFHAYFPAGNAYPSILGDMLSDAIGCQGFSWAASPACTELEMIVLDWIGKLIRLPPAFLHESGKGGGVIQGSASECVLVSLLAARHQTIRSSRRERFPYIDDGFILSKLVAYSSKLAHSCVEKAGMIGLVKMRQLDVDDNYSLRGYTLERAIEEDRRMGLIPFYVCATLGTTGCCSFDNIAEVGEVCGKEGVWLHVDAAYAGSALICPEFHHLIHGIENVSSFNFNPNKWMLVNFDCSLMWVRDRKALTSALTVDPLYLQHEHDDKELDFRHWGIPLSRRFRALKIWFVLRMYGVEGLQAYIRKHVALAKLFADYVERDDQFEVLGRVTMGLVCFRLKGPNALTQHLLKMVNESGKLHMVPALLNEYYVIRFAVCAEDACADDIRLAWRVIRDTAEQLMASKASLEKAKNDEKLGAEELSETESEDEVFDKELFDTDMIFDQQRNTLKRACERRNLFHRMVSDPKGFNRTLLKALSADGRRKYRSESDVEGSESSDERRGTASK